MDNSSLLAPSVLAMCVVDYGLESAVLRIIGHCRLSPSSGDLTDEAASGVPKQLSSESISSDDQISLLRRQVQLSVPRWISSTTCTLYSTPPPYVYVYCVLYGGTPWGANEHPCSVHPSRLFDIIIDVRHISHCGHDLLDIFLLRRYKWNAPTLNPS